MTIEEYCPEIRFINDIHNHYSFLDIEERAILIAAALRREIIKRGEWEGFEHFAWDSYRDHNAIVSPEDYTAWLTDPDTFIRVAGEWVGREES